MIKRALLGSIPTVPGGTAADGRMPSARERQDAMKRIYTRFALLLAALVVLGGCAAAKEYNKRYGWTEAKMLEAGWLPPRPLQVERIYCYRTLARPECYRAEQIDETNRLIGKFEPAVEM